MVAVRGMTVLAGAILASSAAPAWAETVKLGAALSGAAQVGGADAARGTFNISIEVDRGDFCYNLAVSGVRGAGGGYIHAGKLGESGPEVVTLDMTGPRNMSCTTGDAQVLNAIALDPGNYYVSVFSRQYPAGLARGQLAKR